MITAFPLFLLGAMAVFLRRDFGFSEAQLGVLVAVYFGMSALLSAPGGRFAERAGAHFTMAVISALSCLSLVGIAMTAWSYTALVLWVALAGAANSAAQPAATLALVRGIPRGRHGLALGVKQTAPLAASLVSGVAVPVIAIQFGWRWAFGGVGLVGLILISLYVRPGKRRRSNDGYVALPVARREGLFGLTVAAGFAMMANSSLGAFFVESFVVSGIAEGAAGLWFAGGSLIGMLGRLAWGWIVDQRQGAAMTGVALLMAAGAVGMTFLGAFNSGLLMVIGIAFAFGAGWAWAGIMHLGLVRRFPEIPATATGVVHTGAYLGGIVGPILFGLLVERISYRLAWHVMAASLAIAAGLVWVVRTRRGP